jgi:hypothetical protein
MHSVAAFLNVLPSLFSGGHRRHLASITLGQRCARRASSTNLCTKFRFVGVLTIGLVPFALMAQEQAPLKLVDTIACLSSRMEISTTLRWISKATVFF